MAFNPADYIGEAAETVEPTSTPTTDSGELFISPLSGTVGSGFYDSRDQGTRTHRSGDIKAAPGTPVVAPGNMEILDRR
jgi:murein DD-endopeptidase MepM/ murein hydrolase activator NlpD